MKDVPHRFIVTLLITIYLPPRFFNWGNNYFQSSRNNVMITESVRCMDIKKLTWGRFDNQIQSVEANLTDKGKIEQRRCRLYGTDVEFLSGKTKKRPAQQQMLSRIDIS